MDSINISNISRLLAPLLFYCVIKSGERIALAIIDAVREANKLESCKCVRESVAVEDDDNVDERVPSPVSPTPDRNNIMTNSILLSGHRPQSSMGISSRE